MSVQHKPAIASEDLHKLKSSAAISIETPNTLLTNVRFLITLFWCQRGREGQRSLTKSSFQFLEDENGNSHATMTHDGATKNRPGGYQNEDSFKTLARKVQNQRPKRWINSPEPLPFQVKSKLSSVLSVSKAKLGWKV